MKKIERLLTYDILLLCLLLASTFHLRAQQDPMFSQYFFNPISVNPAYAGSADLLNIKFLAREQWLSLDGRPRTQTFTVQSPLRNEAMAIGLSTINDKIGPVNSISFTGDFAYRMNITSTSRLSLGIKAGVNIFQADLTSLQGATDDPLFDQDISAKPLSNFGFGTYYWDERYYIGLSIPKLIRNDISTDDVLMSQALTKRHFFLSGGYVFDLTKDLKLKPTALIRLVKGAPVSTEATVNLLIKESLWAGVMYRLKDALGIMLSYKINQKFRIGYSFDQSLSALNNYNKGTHELMLSFDFKFEKQGLLSPRFF